MHNLKKQVDNLHESLPSSAFCNHSTNFLSWSRKIDFPFVAWPSLYHLRTASSDKTSAVTRVRTWEQALMWLYKGKIKHLFNTNLFTTLF